MIDIASLCIRTSFGRQGAPHSSRVSKRCSAHASLPTGRRNAAAGVGVNATPSDPTPSSLDEGATLCRWPAEVKSAREALPSAGLEGGGGVESKLVEEPISAGSSSSTASSPVARGSHSRPALAAAGPGRAAAGRVAAPRRFSEERSARPMPRVARRPRHRSVARHIAATLAGGCVLLVFAVLVASAADLLSGPDELTFSTRLDRVPLRRSRIGRRPPRPRGLVGSEALERRTKRPAKRSEAPGSVNPKAGPAAPSSARRVRTRQVRRRRPGRARRRSACSAGVAAQPPSTTSSISSGARRPSTRHAQ